VIGFIFRGLDFGEEVKEGRWRVEGGRWKVEGGEGFGKRGLGVGGWGLGVGKRGEWGFAVEYRRG
jgi:hypothetical protein